MIISISGAQGSGKSTLAKSLAKKLKWPRYYMGGLRRAAAKKLGLTLAEYNKLGETNPETDKFVDDYQKELGQTQDNFIIEGRTSWYLIPNSLKIYIDVDPKVGAKRIFDELQENAKDRNEDKNLSTWEDVLASNSRRLTSDKKRYQQYYNIDVNDHKNYDLIIDTSELSKKEALKKIYDYIQEHLENN
ncbi:MAG: cytidylate kinase family protein [Candidatus Falkowbacteria bacterium]